jgi:hypothetical protein
MSTNTNAKKYTSPHRVMDVAPVQLVAVRYSDGSGQILSELMYVIGGVVYADPNNGVNFAKNLSEVKTVLATQVKTIAGAAPAKDNLTSAADATLAEFSNPKVDV